MELETCLSSSRSFSSVAARILSWILLFLLFLSGFDNVSKTMNPVDLIHSPPRAFIIVYFPRALMSKQEFECSASSPPSSPPPLEFERPASSPPCSPQPLEFQYPDYPYTSPPPLKWPIPSYSWPLEYECPLAFEWPPPLEVKCRAPSYGYEYRTPPYSPQPLESECPAPTYSPQPLESDCRAPPYAPTTSYGCHSPKPLEYESSASSPSPPPYSPKPLESESSASSPSPPPYSPKPLESESVSECRAPSYAPRTTSTDLKKPPLKLYDVRGLYAQIGLHCYNLHKGTNLQFLGVQESYRSGIFCSSIVLEAEDPIGNSTCYLNTEICYSNKVEGCMHFVVTRCKLKPEVKRLRRCNERRVVDDFFKGDLPNWIPEDALTGSDKLQYYEMKESEVEQDKDWLQLYAQLAFFAFGFYPERTDPLGLRKVVVQTKEDVEPKKKAKAKNAIFYISFRSSAGQNFNAIIRRTAVEWPEHMELEVKCLM